MDCKPLFHGPAAVGIEAFPCIRGHQRVHRVHDSLTTNCPLQKITSWRPIGGYWTFGHGAGFVAAADEIDLKTHIAAAKNGQR